VSADLAASPINISYDGCVVKGVQREIPLAGVWGLVRRSNMPIAVSV